MKSAITILLLILSMTVSASGVDSTDTSFPQDITGSIASAIRAGDANELATYFNSTIDLTIPGNEGTFSRSQAEMIVKNFFSAYPPLAFTIQQQGNSGEGSKFSIGLLETDNGNFRTYFLIKKSGTQNTIFQLQFEEE